MLKSWLICALWFTMAFLAGCDFSSNEVVSDDNNGQENQENQKKVDTPTSSQFDDVIDYNDFLIDTMDECLDAEDAFLDALSNLSEEDDDTGFIDALDDALSLCEKDIDVLSHTQAYNNDKSFANSIQALLENETAYLQLYDNYLFGEEDLSEAESDQLMETMEDYESRFETLYDQVIEAQKAYASKYHYDIEEDETEDEDNDEYDHIY